MNVLIVDDSPSKCELLSQFIEELNVSLDKIKCVRCAREAREEVNAKPYDLLLIDLILPASRKGEPRADVGFELLQEFAEEGRAFRIIGTTAELGALSDYAEAFKKIAEQLLLINGIDTDWRDSLRSIIQQIQAREDHPQKNLIDFCILTAVRGTEYKAVDELPVNWGAEKVLSSGGLYREVRHEIDGKVRHGLVAHAKQMGMVAACHLAQSVINEFRPRIVLMSGICGGLPGETNLGDLIIAEKSWDWQSGKYAQSGEFAAAPDQIDATPRLVAIAKSLENETQSVLRELFDKTRPPGNPKFVGGPMLSGSSVVASEEIHQLFLAQHRKPVAVDMEAYGVYYACRMAGNPLPDFLCIKSVSDLSNSHKADNYQPFCSAFSARIAWRILEEYFSDSLCGK